MTDHPRGLSSPPRPQLLVSVRSADEAERAVLGGADIIDIKDPGRGPLGRADQVTVTEILERVQSAQSGRLITAALGETADYLSHPDPLPVPQTVHCAKLGLSELADRADWITSWQRIRQQLVGQRRDPLHWIAVAYADPDTCNAPSISAVVQAAIEDAAIAGVLFDTWNKSGPSLLDRVSVPELADIRRRLHRHNRFLAVAGRLSVEDFSRLKTVQPDVIAVRSAACNSSDRRQAVSEERVADLVRRMNRLFPNRTAAVTQTSDQPLSGAH